MDGPRNGSSALRAATTAAALLVALAWAPPAGAVDAPVPAADRGESGTDGGVGFSISAWSGASLMDGALASYQWDVSPRAAWGARALAARGRWTAGLGWRRTGTTQTIDDANSPAVSVTSWEVVGQGRVASVWGAQVLAVATVGRLRIAYDPDQVTLAASGPGSPIVVTLAPVSEWNAGLGVALHRGVVGPWDASLELDHRRFSMETAHRNGNAIEVGRESFGEWSAQVGLMWHTRRS